MDTLLAAVTSAGSLELPAQAADIGVSILLGIAIAVTYMLTGDYSKNFVRTLVILPMLVCVVMIVVSGNIGTGVAVAGAFSLVRFRSLQGSSRDISFIFFSMTIGLAASIGQLLFAAGFTIVGCALLWIMSLARFGDKKGNMKELVITIPEDLDYTEVFGEVFDKYMDKAELVRVKTTNMGSMYQLTYHILMKKDAVEKNMIDDVRVRNGNLTVVCGRMELQPEL